MSDRDQAPFRRYAPYEVKGMAEDRLGRLFRSCSGRGVRLQRLPNAGRALISTFGRKLFSFRPEVPFIPYSAIRALETRVRPTFNVVEIGAGMSTLWLSQRVQHVRSLEWDPYWHGMIQAELASRSKSNVDLRLVAGLADESVADIRDGSIDLAFVDGGSRPVFLKLLWPKLKPGGIAYLDDWDSDTWWVDNYNARHLVEDLSDEVASKTLFIDYSPTQLAVTEGLLLEKRL